MVIEFYGVWFEKREILLEETHDFAKKASIYRKKFIDLPRYS